MLAQVSRMIKPMMDTAAEQILQGVAGIVGGVGVGQTSGALSPDRRVLTTV